GLRGSRPPTEEPAGERSAHPGSPRCNRPSRDLPLESDRDYRSHAGGACPGRQGSSPHPSLTAPHIRVTGRAIRYPPLHLVRGSYVPDMERGSHTSVPDFYQGGAFVWAAGL